MKAKELTKKIFENIKSNWYMPVTEHQVFSTEETVIGTYLGKPLYRKIVNCGALNGAETKHVNHGIANIDRVVGCEVVLTNGIDGYGINSYFESVKNFCTADANKTKINIFMGELVNWVTDVQVILEYTKTTDTATTSKVPFEPLHEWSTDEKLVGYWVNGKPVYERTFTGTAPTYTPKGGQYVSIPLANIDEVIDLSGTIRYSTNGITGYMTLPFMAENSTTDKQGMALYTVKDYSEIADGIIIQAAGTSTDVVSMYSGQPYRVTIRYTKTTD